VQRRDERGGRDTDRFRRDERGADRDELDEILGGGDGGVLGEVDQGDGQPSTGRGLDREFPTGEGAVVNRDTPTDDLPRTESELRDVFDGVLDDVTSTRPTESDVPRGRDDPLGASPRREDTPLRELRETRPGARPGGRLDGRPGSEIGTPTPPETTTEPVEGLPGVEPTVESTPTTTTPTTTPTTGVTTPTVPDTTTPTTSEPTRPSDETGSQTETRNRNRQATGAAPLFGDSGGGGDGSRSRLFDADDDDRERSGFGFVSSNDTSDTGIADADDALDAFF
jgi:hypothetical protein